MQQLFYQVNAQPELSKFGGIGENTQVIACEVDNLTLIVKGKKAEHNVVTPLHKHLLNSLCLCLVQLRHYKLNLLSFLQVEVGDVLYQTHESLPVNQRHFPQFSQASLNNLTIKHTRHFN